MKNNKGITMIALIITIIVMLILAGVALSFTIGEDGVINKAEETEEKQKRATERDRIQLAMADAQIKGMKEITWNNFEDSVIKEFGNTAQVVNERKDFFLVKVGENEYTAYKAGKVEDEYKLIKEKIPVLCSTEIPVKIQSRKPGSVSLVPNVAGFYIASYPKTRPMFTSHLSFQ